MGEEQVLELEPTLRPGWMSDDQMWADQYHDAPIRLDIECHRAGLDPWQLLCDVEQPQSQFRTRVTARAQVSQTFVFDNVGNAAARKPRIATDQPDNDGLLTGPYHEVVEPGQATQAITVLTSGRGAHQWIELSWTDPRGAHATAKVNLPV